MRLLYNLPLYILAIIWVPKRSNLKRILIQGIFLLIPIFSYAQDTTIERPIQTEAEYKNSIFYLIQESWLANRKPSTASLLANYTPSVGDRRIPLRDREGETSDFNLLEADLFLVFPLLNGRKDYGSGFRKLTRLNFDYGVNFRMTYDRSKPITPPSQRVGLSLNLNVWNNYSHHLFNSWNRNNDDEMYILGDSENLKFLNLLVQLHHYSNGQSGESTFTHPQYIQNRNNYIDGDFSTNYLNTVLVVGFYNLPDLDLHQLSLGYRWDWGKDDFMLAYAAPQEKAYGRHRVSINYDYRSSIDTKIPWHVRLETGYIIGDLTEFQPNLENDDNKYRFNGKLFFELNPKFNRSVGFFASLYYGRDYMNIRYDNIITSLQAGLTLSLDSYSVTKAEALID